MFVLTLGLNHSFFMFEMGTHLKSKLGTRSTTEPLSRLLGSGTSEPYML